MVITCSQKRLKSDTNCECTYEMAMLPEIHAKAKHFSFYQNSQFHCKCLTGENKESEEVGLQDSLHRISYHTRLERQIQADSRTIMHIHTQVMSCHQNHIVLKLKPLVQCAHM